MGVVGDRTLVEVVGAQVDVALVPDVTLGAQNCIVVQGVCQDLVCNNSHKDRVILGGNVPAVRRAAV